MYLGIKLIHYFEQNHFYGIKFTTFTEKYFHKFKKYP